MPKAYWIVHVSVSDPETYDKYRAANAAPLAEFGARFVVRGGAQTLCEGNIRPRTVVLEFPSLAAAAACYNSPGYRAALTLREAASEADFCIVEGWDE